MAHPYCWWHAHFLNHAFTSSTLYHDHDHFLSCSTVHRFYVLWRHEVDLCSRVWSQIAWHTATHAFDTSAERALLWSSKCQPPSPSTLMAAVIDLQCGHKKTTQWQHSWSELLLWMLSVTKHEWEQLHDIFQRMRWDGHQTTEQTSKSALSPWMLSATKHEWNDDTMQWLLTN